MTRSVRIEIGGLHLLPDLSGALYIPDHAMLVVADLHLEKASSLARRGAHLPPYDTRATLDLLAEVMRRLQPKRLVLLGDSFHDPAAEERVLPQDQAGLLDLTSSCDTVWIAGNHDPAPSPGLGGVVAQSLSLGPLTLRHAPLALSPGECEIAGHLHPAAAIVTRARRIRAKCFVSDGRRLIMPAFGSLTGGLDVLSAPIAACFPAQDFSVWMLGSAAIHRFPAARLR